MGISTKPALHGKLKQIFIKYTLLLSIQSIDSFQNSHQNRHLNIISFCNDEIYEILKFCSQKEIPNTTAILHDENIRIYAFSSIRFRNFYYEIFKK